MDEKKQFSHNEGKFIGDTLGLSWNTVDVEQFSMGLNIEFEHGRRDQATGVTHDAPMRAGKSQWSTSMKSVTPMPE